MMNKWLVHEEGSFRNLMSKHEDLPSVSEQEESTQIMLQKSSIVFVAFLYWSNTIRKINQFLCENLSYNLKHTKPAQILISKIMKR